MKKLIKEIFLFVIFLAFASGALLLAKQYYFADKPTEQTHQLTQQGELDHKSEMLKTYLLGIKKPQRIEFTNLSQRFDKVIQNFKQIKIPQDKNSDFYLSIQFFTDEGDNSAPLVAQIRYIDIKSGNTIKEESINLE